MKIFSGRFIAGGAVLGLCVCATLTCQTPASAQQGFAFRGGAVFNSSEVRAHETNLRLSDAAGWSAGLEYLLPFGLSIGASGYTSGSPSAFALSESSLVMLADANLLMSLPALPIKAYAGAHVGLGTYTMDKVRDFERPQVDFGDRGFQLGIRIQLLRQFGIDAQYRRVSGSLAEEQDQDFETKQFTLGAVIF